MASQNKDERAYVNALIKAIRKNSPRVYVYIDRDAGFVRHTSSGFDFLLADMGRVVFCEAKVGNGKLSAWQGFVKTDVTASGTPYLVVRFWDGGTCFTVENGPRIDVDKARITDFVGPRKIRACEN